MTRAVASTPATTIYAARTTPFGPETVWSVQDDALVETRGERRRAWPLDSLRVVKVVGEAGSGRRAAHLVFGKGRLIVPAQSLSTALTLEDRSAAFDAFLAALGATAAAPARPRVRGLAAALVWMIGLTAAGAAFMIVAALVSGMADLGLALGARLLFAPILLSAALPWLGRDLKG